MSALSKVRGVNVRKDDTRRLEEEAQKMELKMEMLRKTIGASAAERGASGPGDCGGRWKNGTAKKPLRNGYVKDVLDRPSRGSKRADPRQHNLSGPEGGSAPGSAPGSKPGSAGGSARSGVAQEAPRSNLETMLSATGSTAKAGPPPTGAAANLQAAMSEQNKEMAEVEAFLAGIGLDRYVGLFMEHGFDCMEAVQEMEECHMREIGIATGHALKLRKRLADMRPAPAPAPAPAQAAPSANLTQKRVSFGNTEQASLRSPGGGVGCGGEGPRNLLEGAFDEEESKASFQEAVRAWREGRTCDDAGTSSATTAVSNKSEHNPPKVGPGSFWSSMGGEEVNLERCSTPLAAPKEAAETQHNPAPSEEKLCCYQCYKQYFAKYTVERASPLPDRSFRRFCSEACADIWMAGANAKAEELQKRHEKLQKMEEIKRALDTEAAAAAAAAPAVAAA
mmetsp:Transcript_160063/g.282209  ORF Transcript_160063/g.282209 Transcript_160063/m.282209 type:complete len:450 (-) Transcript_160063:61-1410(-)